MQTYLKPLGAPISALVSLGPFFLSFLFLFNMLKPAGAGTGTLGDRFCKTKMSGFAISVVAIGPKNKHRIQYVKQGSRYIHQRHTEHC